ncbi:flagellar assembly protein FliX [Pseudoroseomonas cervicalis]|uniref:flagellar assembly protein FliX n=1 Tax=Teichococcus cervicalis TaxID=204525 RepID=UPI0022F19FDE|nr:flagellar assembly protein FliX [Pseudoroseomonas cervicalis]WBV44561.1 hypothetical protein PFY06_08400 [Pseudoroseomonas cervicalis]
MRATPLPAGTAIGQATPRPAATPTDNATSQLFVARLQAASQPAPARVALAAAAAPLMGVAGLAASLPRERRGEARAIAGRGLEALEKLQLSMLGGDLPGSGDLLALAAEAESAAEADPGEIGGLCRQLALRLRLEAAKQEAQPA